MNNSTFNDLCNEILALIEIEEGKLLGWGFVNIHIDLRREISTILNNLPATASSMWSEALKGNYTEQDIIQNLMDRRLLFEVPKGHRSRFAETVRLLFLLRQRFSDKDWQTAPRLVSDFKLQLQRRRYPKRDIEVEQVEKILESLNISPLPKNTILELLQDPNKGPLQLSQFQLDAIVQQIKNLHAGKDRALVIGAGTGAGKTKAFYIPALAHIANSIQPQQYSLQALAIYPRTELLKDQLGEAFSEIRKLDGLMTKSKKRKISIGAYYGDTPRAASDFLGEKQFHGWKQTDDLRGWICPFFTCLNNFCNHADMVWSQQDIESEADANKRNLYGQFTRLRCKNQCGFETDPSQLLLTRSQMVRYPPDILFTTTEMLNRRLSRASEHALFGIDTDEPPRLVLLDEIHTYEGIAGAQIAYLLRRWRQARRKHGPQYNLCFVGLSATLTEAETFFAKLTGLPDNSVFYIHPHEDNLITEGIEYNLVLKGDPVSGTSLLSTSVQTAMLLGRALDNGDIPISKGAYGTKTFAFTDKLDVINRWYYIQHDAEYIKNLSQWRQSTGLDGDQRQERYESGQVWRMSELIGHALDRPLRLGRTTSQDRGLNANDELVIATSTLEVGFNDPAVGAIIQHKAPRSMASFLQRKGRAGRQRGMRPWMALITSAYGRDRWAFQHAEDLFSPYLPPIHLPLDNYYTRKIQASFALMDWLALTLKSQIHLIDIWQLLSSGPNNRSGWLDQQRALVVKVLKDLLAGVRLDEFTTYMTQALSLQNDEAAVRSILWGEPRSLLYNVIPSMLRQLETKWQRINKGKPQKWADDTAPTPLPRFVPSALFNDLNVPEVKIIIPSEHLRRNEEREELMGLAETLVEFAPGRANKRFILTRYTDHAHWLTIPDQNPDTIGKISIHSLKADFDPLPISVRVYGTPYMVYRPRQYNLDVVPDNVRTTSYSQLQWLSSFEVKSLSARRPQSDNKRPDRPRRTLTVFPPHSRWHRILQSVELFAQANGDWVEVIRLATGVQVDTRYKDGKSFRETLHFVDKQAEPAAIGFSATVDALKFNFFPLDVSSLFNRPEWPRLYRSFAPHYFLHVLQQDVRLGHLSIFEIEWLWQIELSILTAVAISRSCSLVEAADEVQANRPVLAERALDIIFQSQTVDEEGDSVMTGKLHKQLLKHLADLDIKSALSTASTALWEPNQDNLADWISGCYASSLGATLFTAVTQLIPDIEPDDLLMDIEEGCIWISEVTAGGLGLISKIAAYITQHPRQFELQLLDTLTHCDREQLAHQLQAVAKLIEKQDSELQTVFNQARQETDLLSLINVQQALTDILNKHGIPPTRQLFVALNNKILRPNSDIDTDKLISDLVKHWEIEEERLGNAIDMRVMAVAGYRIPEIKTQVTQVLKRISNQTYRQDENQVFNLLQSLLWLNCVDSCPDCIQTWNRYQSQIRPSRALLMLLLAPYGQKIDYGDAYWESQTQEALIKEYQAEIYCSQTDLAACKISLLQLLTRPIDIGFQSFYPIIERISRNKQQWVFHLTIRELAGD